MRYAALIASFLLLCIITYPAAGQTASPDDLPLLEPGQHISASYGEGAPEAADALQALYMGTLEAGASGYALSFMWTDLETAPGVIDLSRVEELFGIMETLDMQPLVTLRTIDTVVLALPGDLINADGTDFAAGYGWDHPAVRERFFALLDALVPLVLEYEGFAISVANEIDPYLGAHPAQVAPFVAFLADARTHIQQIAPEMAVGATMTLSGLLNGWDGSGVLANSDVAFYTYYPLAGDFTVREPDVVFEDMAFAVELAGERPIILQEAGYPSGYLDGPGNNSSIEKQAQFVTNMFATFAEYPQIRYVSFLHLGEWSDATCDSFLDYYALAEPRFREYLCTLGMVTYDGEPKLAYDTLLQGLRDLDG